MRAGYARARSESSHCTFAVTAAAPANVDGHVFLGKFDEPVSPVTYALPAASTANASYVIDTASRTVVDVEAAIKRMQPVGIQRENSPRQFADAEL